MPCAFAKFGCGVELKKAALKDHEKTCIYRTITCLSPTCDELHPISSYMDHVREKHANDVKIWTENELILPLNLKTYFEAMRRNKEPSVSTLNVLCHDNHQFFVKTKLLIIHLQNIKNSNYLPYLGPRICGNLMRFL